MAGAAANSSNSLLSQELFDETILENEECFDLSPHDALLETIEQFCQQLGVDNPNTSSNDNDNNAAAKPLPSSAIDDIATPISTNEAAAAAVAAVVLVPPALSHLVLHHPHNPHGQRLRSLRTSFQRNLNLLDECVNTDGTVDVYGIHLHDVHDNNNDNNDEFNINNANANGNDNANAVVKALVEIGSKCHLGDGGDNDNHESTDTTAATATSTDTSITGSSPLPYLTIVQQTSSIYTLMSFLSVLNNNNTSSSDAAATADATAARLPILNATVQTLSHILTNNNTATVSDDTIKCRTLRADLRDLFIPALVRVVNLIGTIVSQSQSQQQLYQGTNTDEGGHSNDNVQDQAETMLLSHMSVLCNLLHLATNATRGCEGGKVAWVQSTLVVSSELNDDDASIIVNTTANKTKRGGIAVLISCLSMLSSSNNTNSVTNNMEEEEEDDDTVKMTSLQIQTEACQLLASLCRYDDFRTETAAGGGSMDSSAGINASSAHDHAMEFQRAGAPALLIGIARGVLGKLSLLLVDGQEGDGEETNGSSSTEEEGEVVCNEQKKNNGASSVVVVAAQYERLAAAVLTALRVLAVNDEIIQTMVALGMLPIVTRALQLGEQTTTNNSNNARKQRLAAASLGLLRNLCGNDEIKTNLCLGSSIISSSSSDSSSSATSTSSVLPHVLAVMQAYPDTTTIQEHACGAFAAMALRRPANARAILDADGPRLVLLAMKRHTENVNVQRQGALAVRNIVSRLLRDLPEDSPSAAGNDNNNGGNDERSSIRDAFLELGAEDILRNTAGRHQGSVDEAYAALRDLGCTVSLVKFNAEDLQSSSSGGQQRSAVNRTMMFGEKHNTNFRPVYDESTGLADGVDTAISQFGS